MPSIHGSRLPRLKLLSFVFVVLANSAAIQAQVPPGWAVVAGYHFTGYPLGGLHLVHPSQPGAALPVTGLPAELTGPSTSSNFGMGAQSVLHDPRSGRLVVGEVAPAGNSVDIHLITLQGTAVSSIVTYPIGTPPNTFAAVPQMAWLGEDIVFGFTGRNVQSGPMAQQLLGILRPRLGPPGTPGTLAPVPMSPLPSFTSPGGLRAITVDEENGFAYMATENAGISTGLWRVGVPGPGTAVAPTLLLTIPAVVRQMAFTGGKILVSGVVDNVSFVPYLASVNPATLAVVPLPSAMLVNPLGMCIEPESGALLVADFGIGSLARVEAGSTALGVTPGIPTGVAVNRSMQVYGDGTPGVGQYSWRNAPNPGLAPTVGNLGFSLTLDANPGAAPGLLALGLDAAMLPFASLGFTLLVEPSTMLATQFLPAQPVTVVPLPLPPVAGFAGISFYVQALMLESTSIAATRGLRVGVH